MLADAWLRAISLILIPEHGASIFYRLFQADILSAEGRAADRMSAANSAQNERAPSSACV
jgi:hypothetical protein